MHHEKLAFTQARQTMTATQLDKLESQLLKPRDATQPAKLEKPADASQMQLVRAECKYMHVTLNVIEMYIYIYIYIYACMDV